MSLTHDAFLGTWIIERVIHDNLSGTDSLFSGTASITRNFEGSALQGAWLYHEEGRMRIPGLPPMTAERRYLWQPQEGGFACYFEDARPFHRMSVGALTQSDHWCDPDQYDVSYEFGNWPAWASVWTVKGPRKDYDMRSEFTRKA